MILRQKAFLTVVSGLPRSGTSMMMRMLEAGGLPVLTDGIRAGDEDNPNGYYELEAVKRTKEDPSWITRSKGYAAKMVYRLVYDLPPGHLYRVVFMRRELREILASQKVMLQRHGQLDESVPDDQMAALFHSELDHFLKWSRQRQNLDLLEVSYNGLLSDPDPLLQVVDEFLGGGLDRDAMRRVIEPNLYRNRLTS